MECLFCKSKIINNEAIVISGWLDMACYPCHAEYWREERGWKI